MMECRTRFALTIACVLTSSCSTAATPQSNFAGSWAYIKKCDHGHSLNLTIEQTGEHVTGEWSEGTNLRGGDGKLKGNVRGGKLFVRYCSTDGEATMSVCPEYDDYEDLFELNETGLVRSRKSGSNYEKDVTLHRDDLGKDVPIDNNCYDKDDNQ